MFYIQGWQGVEEYLEEQRLRVGDGRGLRVQCRDSVRTVYYPPSHNLKVQHLFDMAKLIP